MFPESAFTSRKLKCCDPPDPFPVPVQCPGARRLCLSQQCRSSNRQYEAGGQTAWKSTKELPTEKPGSGSVTPCICSQLCLEWNTDPISAFQGLRVPDIYQTFPSFLQQVSSYPLIVPCDHSPRCLAIISHILQMQKGRHREIKQEEPSPLQGYFHMPLGELSHSHCIWATEDL